MPGNRGTPDRSKRACHVSYRSKRPWQALIEAKGHATVSYRSKRPWQALIEAKGHATLAIEANGRGMP